MSEVIIRATGVVEFPGPTTLTDPFLGSIQGQAYSGTTGSTSPLGDESDATYVTMDANAAAVVFACAAFQSHATLPTTGLTKAEYVIRASTDTGINVPTIMVAFNGDASSATVDPSDPNVFQAASGVDPVGITEVAVTEAAPSELFATDFLGSLNDHGWYAGLAVIPGGSPGTVRWYEAFLRLTYLDTGIYPLRLIQRDDRKGRLNSSTRQSGLRLAGGVR